MRFKLPVLASALVALAGCAAEEPKSSETPGLEVEILRDIVLTDDARIPENDPAYVGVEVFRDHLVFQFEGSPDEPLEAGNVVVGSGGDMGYLRRITSVTPMPDGKIEVGTEDAVLTDLIYQGHFIVRYDPHEAAAAAATEPLVDGIAGRREALDSTSGAVVLVSAPGSPLQCGGGSTTTSTASPYLDFDYVFELEVDIDWERAWLVVPKPKLAKFRLELGGSVQAGIQVEGTSAHTLSCNLDLAELTGLDEAKITLPTLTFSVGPVPVVITNEIEPVFDFTVSEDIQTDSFNYSGEAGFGLTMGVLYEDGDWSPIWEPDAFSNGAFHSGSRGLVSITDRVAAGIEYQSRIYGLAGPNMGLETYIEATGGTDADLCTWELGISSGLTATFGGALEVDVGPIDWTIAEIMIGSVDLVSSPLWTGSGTFPWCDACEVGEATCTDDLGRDICLGNEGILMCAGGTMRCTCSPGGGFSSCGTCVHTR